MNETCVGAVIVTYNPDEGALERLLEAVVPQVDLGVIVDNGSHNSPAVSRLAGKHSIDLIECGNNIGIAAAQNRGIVYVLNEGADYVLLSDQDSIPAPDMVECLLAGFAWGRGEGAADLARRERQPAEVAALDQFPGTAVTGPVAAVGPVPLDKRGGSAHALVYSFTKWGPKRREVPEAGEVMEVPFVLASGCLVSREALLTVGPMDESLFIDHVDLAWCLRAIEKGFRILVSGSARIYHSLGDEVARVPGRKRAVHLHSPARNYYMLRNTLLLQSATFLPQKWKNRYLWWMAKYMTYYVLAPGRGHRIPAMAQGLWDGVRGVSGPKGSDRR